MLIAVRDDSMGFLSFKYFKIYYLNPEKTKKFSGKNFLTRINNKVW